MPSTTPERVRYGQSPSQFVELWPGPEQSGRGVAVLLHGGWWRAQHGLDQLDPMCSDLFARGWAVANVEYRRIDGDDGGWPVTLTDVIAAIGVVRDRWRGAGPIVAIGHSAGGHLALLSAAESEVDAVVALAPITDLVRCAEAALGEGATTLLMGATPDAGAQSYRAASPLSRLPLGVPYLVVHGSGDERVPVEHSRDYIAAASAAGDTPEYVELPGVDHFAVTDPAHRAWAYVCAWLDGRFPKTADDSM